MSLSYLAVIDSCDTPFDVPPPSSTMAERGVTVGDWTPWGIAGAAGGECLDDVAEAGANVAVYIVTLRQQEATSSEIESPFPMTPEPDAFRAAAAAARDRGLEVALKLQVDVDDGTWRAHSRPANPATWFEDYGAHVAGWASTARDAGAGVFVIGTELAGTIEHEELWRALIASTRARFSGRILYAASWDEADRVPFWDAVDAVGVDAYFPVADRPDATRMEMLVAWQPWLDRLSSLSRRSERDVVLTELGYRSADGAGMDPAIFAASTVKDSAEQADLYWAALTALEDANFVRGVYWWNFRLPGADASRDTDYTPQGKPAFDVLRAAWRGTT
jgi:hypothetical protein